MFNYGRTFEKYENNISVQYNNIINTLERTKLLPLRTNRFPDSLYYTHESRVFFRIAGQKIGKSETGAHHIHKGHTYT